MTSPPLSPRLFWEITGWVGLIIVVFGSIMGSPPVIIGLGIIFFIASLVDKIVRWNWVRIVDKKIKDNEW